MNLTAAAVCCLILFEVFAHAVPIDIDCQGEYSPWSVCEPLEGHATHHDSDDDFKLERGPEGEFLKECFHFQTYRIVVHKQGDGLECSHKNGSKRFRYCDDCSGIPYVHKRLDAQQATDSLHIFTIIAGTFCVFAVIALSAICVRKALKDGYPPLENVTACNTTADPTNTHLYPATFRGTPIPNGVTMRPEHSQNPSMAMPHKADRHTDVVGTDCCA